MLSVLIKVLLTAVLFHWVGSVVLRVLCYRVDAPFYRLFLQQLAGATLAIVVTAFLYTGGVTVLAGFIAIGAGFYLQKRKLNLQTSGLLKELRDDWPGSTLMLYALTAMGLLVLIQFLRLYPGGGVISIPHPDYVFYAKATVWMTTHGLESYLFDFVYPEEVQPAPYHYMDLWLHALVNRIWGGVSLVNLMLITYSYSLWLAWLAMASLAETVVRNTLLVFLLAAGMMFFAPLSFSAPPLSFLEGNLHVFQKQNVIAYLKISVVFWYLTPAFISLLKGKNLHALLFFSALTLAYIAAAPAALAAMGVVVIVLWLEKRIPRLKLLLPALAGIAFGPLFYLVTTGDAAGGSDSWTDFLRNRDHWITAVNIAGKTTLQHVFLVQLHLALVVLVWLWPQRKRQVPVLLPLTMAVMLLAGLLAWGLLNRTLDAHQLFTNVANGIFPLAFLLLGLLNIQYGGLKRILTLLIFAVTFAWGVSRFFLSDHPLLRGQGTTTQEKLKELKTLLADREPVGVFFLPEAYYHNIYFSNHRLIAPGQELALVFPHLHPVSLSALDVIHSESHRDYHTLQKYLHQAPFYRFVKNRNKETTLEEAQLEFVRDMGVSFVVAPADYELPAPLQSLVERTVPLGKEGEVMYLLKTVEPTQK